MCLRETIKSYIARFEDALLSITKSNQHLGLAVFKKGLLVTSKLLKDHSIVDARMLTCIMSYHDAKILISSYIKIKETEGSRDMAQQPSAPKIVAPSNKHRGKGQHHPLEAKKAHYDDEELTTI